MMGKSDILRLEERTRIYRKVIRYTSQSFSQSQDLCVYLWQEHLTLSNSLTLRIDPSLLYPSAFRDVVPRPTFELDGSVGPTPEGVSAGVLLAPAPIDTDLKVSRGPHSNSAMYGQLERWTTSVQVTMERKRRSVKCRSPGHQVPNGKPGFWPWS